MIIWGFLSVLWPLTYMKIHVIFSFYLQYYKIMGIYGGAILTAIVGVMFLYSIASESASATYPLVYLLVNPVLILISYMYYETAHAFYLPQYVELPNKVEPKDDIPEEEEEEVIEEPEEPKDDTSPFVDFLLVTI